jgi:hypothetical protein
MFHPLRILIVVVAAAVPVAAAAATTIVYDFTSQATAPNHPTRAGHTQVTATIDGPRFRNVSSLGNAVELSDDDGRTTYFGAFHSTPQTPLGPDGDGLDGKSNLGPISGAIEDEQLTVEPPSPGPTLLGLPTRVYTVDYRYRIAVRIAGITTSHTTNEEHYTITAADIDVSSAALRVAFSRGYGHAVSRHAEAFVGLPLRIDGTLKSGSQTATVHIEAQKLDR